MKITVYVAGPLTDFGLATPVQRKQNMMKAIGVGEYLLNAGLIPFVPHINETWDDLYEHDYETWMQWCLTFLERCDILYRMSGASTGADREVARAKELGIPVYTRVMELLQDWGYYGQQKAGLEDKVNAREGRASDQEASTGPLWYY